MHRKNLSLTLRQKIAFKRKLLPFGSLKKNQRTIIWWTKLLPQYLHQARGSCMKQASFTQDYLMEVLNISPVVNVFSTSREWEKLPWTGHLCFLFIRAWEIRRWKSHHNKVGEFNQMRTLWERARARGSDWMRGSQEPLTWDQRLEIDKNAWPENWLMCERDHGMEWFF